MSLGKLWGGGGVASRSLPFENDWAKATTKLIASNGILKIR